MCDGVLHCLCFFLLFFWCPCMAINVSVQYNGGLLPDIILLTQRNFHRGTRLNAMKRFCICSLWSHLNVLTFSPPLTGGCSEGLGAFWFFFKKYILPCPRSRLKIWSRETDSAVPSRVINLLILPAQAQFGAYWRDSSRFYINLFMWNIQPVVIRYKKHYYPEGKDVRRTLHTKRNESQWYKNILGKSDISVETKTSKDEVTACNSMFARLGTDNERRNQCFFTISEVMATDWDLSQWTCNDRLQQAVSLIICASQSDNYWFRPDS